MLITQSDDSAVSTRQASCIGIRAKSLVSRPGFSGQVTAVLSDVAYLSGRDGEILWVCREGVPLHGRGILLSFLPRGLRSGQSFRMEGPSLKVGNDLAIDLARAAEWAPVPLGRHDIGPLAGVRESARQCVTALSPAVEDDGPGRVILGISSAMNEWMEAPWPSGSLEYSIFSPVFEVMKQCLEEGLRGIGISGRELIGLGPGLTPCGDDFLGGILFAAYWLREACPEKIPADRQSVCDLIKWGESRTTPVSHAVLGDLAAGQGPEPLHASLRYLLRGEGRGGRVPEAVTSLLKLGHTTGWFMLAGLLTGLLSVGEHGKSRH